MLTKFNRIGKQKKTEDFQGVISVTVGK